MASRLELKSNKSKGLSFPVELGACRDWTDVQSSSMQESKRRGFLCGKQRQQQNNPSFDSGHEQRYLENTRLNIPRLQSILNSHLKS